MVPEPSSRSVWPILESPVAKSDADKMFRFFVGKNEFKLMDIPELSLHDVLVVPVKETQIHNPKDPIANLA